MSLGTADFVLRNLKAEFYCAFCNVLIIIALLEPKEYLDDSIQHDRMNNAVVTYFK